MRVEYNGDEYVISKREEMETFVWKVLENISEDEFVDVLNDLVNPVIIFGYEWGQASALKILDPIAYSQAVDEYKESLCEDAICEVEDACEGETVYIMNEEIEIIETDDEEDE